MVLSDSLGTLHESFSISSWSAEYFRCYRHLKQASQASRVSIINHVRTEGINSDPGETENPSKSTHLEALHLPACQLQVVFGAVPAVLTLAVEEVLGLQHPPPLLRRVQEVHVSHGQLLSLRDLTQGTQLDPGQDHAWKIISIRAFCCDFRLKVEV